MTQIQSTKSRDNKSTLLHYLARVIEQTMPEVFQIVTDLAPTATDASKGS
jgi:hypothetical protein